MPGGGPGTTVKAATDIGNGNEPKVRNPHLPRARCFDLGECRYRILIRRLVTD